jgi:DNA primase catalytic core
MEGDEQWHCFACGQSGDIFTTAHLLEGRPLDGSGFIPDNVLYLAERYGIDYELESGSNGDARKKRAYEILKHTADLLARALEHTKAPEDIKAAREYVRQRGWDGLEEKFGFGCCHYDKLLEKLRGCGYSDAELEYAGVLDAVDKDAKKRGTAVRRIFDRRLIIPMRNEYGKVVAFVSRQLNDDGSPRYLNSKASELYDKSRFLYNFHAARGTGTKLYVAEGQASVFTLTKHGLSNVICCGGTAFTEQHYELLVKYGVKKVVFVFDADDAGRLALSRTMNVLRGKNDLDVFVKLLPFPDDKESKATAPDDFVRENGIQAFREIKEVSEFEWRLQRWAEEPNNYLYREDVLRFVSLFKSPIEKEQHVKRIADATGFTVSAISQELRDYEDGGVDLYRGVTVADLVEERGRFEQDIRAFDEWAWTRGKLLGLSSGWPLFDLHMDGVQNTLHIIGGKSNRGKSAFCLSLAFNIVLANENAFLLYFSIDDTLKDSIPRLVAMDVEIPINTIKNPRHKIQLHEQAEEDEKTEMLDRRERGVSRLIDMSRRFAMKDESTVRTLADLHKFIRIYKVLAQDKQLVVFIDNIHNIQGGRELREHNVNIAETIKSWCTIYDIPIIGTVELTKSATDNANISNIAEARQYEYRAGWFGMVRNDITTNPNTKLAHVHEGQRWPVIELHVEKNKEASFRGMLYYKFFPMWSKVVECSEDERKGYFQAENE